MFGTRSRSLGLLTIVAGMLLPGCVAATKYHTLEDDLARTQEELEYARQQVLDAETLLQDAYVDAGALAAANARAESAEAEKQRLADAMDSMQGKSALLAQRGIEVVYDAESGWGGFRGGADVFFVSGSDALSVDGKETLNVIVDELKRLEGPIRVDGHTDSDPVSKTKDKFPHGNIQLGASRAISVREYLISKGIPENRVWIASHGSFKPVASGDSKEAKAKNRRVEILIPVGRPAGRTN